MGAITATLLPMLKQTFPERAMRAGTPPDPVATFPAAHPDVGDLRIWDEGDEATVAIGEITHSHFNPYDSSLSADQIAARVSAEIVDFLEDLFADRVLLWSSGIAGSGGWQQIPANAPPQFMGSNARTYHWSGPIPNPLADGAS